MKEQEEWKKLIEEAVKKSDEEQDKEFKWIVDFERKEGQLYHQSTRKAPNQIPLTTSQCQ